MKNKEIERLSLMAEASMNVCKNLWPRFYYIYILKCSMILK